VPHAWAASFLDSRTPYESWQIGAQLISTLDTADDRDRVLPFAKWLQTACVKRGLTAGDRRFSGLYTAPDARVIWWVLNRLRPYPKAPAVQQGGTIGVPGLATVAMAAGATAAATAAREYSPFKVQRIQAACTLTPNVYSAELPKVFVQMLEEGCTKIRTRGVMHAGATRPRRGQQF
jgi:hypothetical protein